MLVALAAEDAAGRLLLESRLLGGCATDSGKAKGALMLSAVTACIMVPGWWETISYHDGEVEAPPETRPPLGLSSRTLPLTASGMD